MENARAWVINTNATCVSKNTCPRSTDPPRMSVYFPVTRPSRCNATIVEGSAIVTIRKWNNISKSMGLIKFSKLGANVLCTALTERNRTEPAREIGHFA